MARRKKPTQYAHYAVIKITAEVVVSCTGK